MMRIMNWHDAAALLLVAMLPGSVLAQEPAQAQTQEPAQSEKPPFEFVWGEAYHILPETHNNESGYFSLCVGHNGRVYVGTAKYGVNAFLVEFDPQTEQQRIVIDTHALCDLSATGYAAQAKIHTRNHVGASGTIYVGSKQGYPSAAEKASGDVPEYPGGYVMSYDPQSDDAKCLGMPMKGQGVIDVVADEERELLYVVSCEEQHWLVGAIDGSSWREIGPLLTPYITTLVDSRGIASAITADFQLAQYDPKTQQVTVRPIALAGTPWQRENRGSIPYWILMPDGRTAYLVLMNDPTLISIDLHQSGETVAARAHGKMVDGEGPDTRSGITLGPDGNLYMLFRVRNDTGYATNIANLHHLVRFDPDANAHEDLGVVGVKNPDYFDFSPGEDGKPRPWTNGMPTLPDGKRAPLHVHMGIAAAPDGSLYATFISPFTLMRFEGAFPPQAQEAAAQ